MSTWMQHNRIAVHLGILGIAVIFASAVLLIGYDSTSELPPELGVGEPSPETFRANANTSAFPDDEKTEQAREIAENNVPAPFDIDFHLLLNLAVGDLPDRHQLHHRFLRRPHRRRIR